MRAAGALGISSALLLSAGCSGDDSGAGSAPPTAPGSAGAPASSDPQSGAQAAARNKLAECLRKQGLEVPDGKSSLSPAAQAAVQTCGLAVLGGMNPDMRKRLDTLRACMGKHGAKVPPAGRPFTPDTRDPKTVAALKACRPQTPAG